MLKLDDAFETILDWLHNLNVYIDTSDADDIAQNFDVYSIGLNLKTVEDDINILNEWRKEYKRNK